MSFNMQNKVPVNVTIPEFVPERQAPIYPYQVRRYPCQENLKGKRNTFGRLTWKIQCPDASLVWQQVKLVLPLQIESADPADDALDMRINSKLPCCNIAITDSVMCAFRQTSLTLNGAIYTQENTYRRILDTAYIGQGVNNQANNHSLKPIVCRDLKNPMRSDFVQAIARAEDGSESGFVYPVISTTRIGVTTEYIQAKTLDAAYSLLENNGGFIERARAFQDNLDETGTKWLGDITNLLELGPFQARGRRGNTSVPYINDFHLILNFDEFPSRFDNLYDTELPKSSRTVPNRLLEYATIPVLKHVRESVIDTDNPNFPAGFAFTWTGKPYLEVTFCKFLEPMKPIYNLRCIEHQLDQSPEFFVAPKPDPAANPDGKISTVTSDTQVARVTTRLLSYPTKVYLWADYSQSAEGSFIFGNCRRSCHLDNIHCRILQRSDALFNPSQEDCFEMFQRNTNSSLDYQTWRKSPIYCFTPVDLGQSDMFASDARVTIMEFDAEVSLTPLQVQETKDALDIRSLFASGYKHGITDVLTWNQFRRAGSYAGDVHAWWWQKDDTHQLHPGGRTNIPATGAKSTQYVFALEDTRSDGSQHKGINMHVPHFDDMIKQTAIQFAATTLGQWTEASPSPEIFVPTSVSNKRLFWNGMVWARMKVLDREIVGGNFYWIPESSMFIDTDLVDAKCVTSFSALHYDQGTTKWNVDTPAELSVYHAQAYDTQGTGTLKLFNPLAGKEVDGDKAAVPGKIAYKITVAGIANDVKLKPGEGSYLPIDQTQAGADQWIIIQPGSSGEYTPWGKFLHDDDDMAQVQGSTPWQGQGHTQILVEGDWARAQFGTVKSPTFNVVFAHGYDRGFNMAQAQVGVEGKHNFGYTMKALYEYGNANYQFSNQGLPTKVLPNLVPVSDSSAIPKLKPYYSNTDPYSRRMPKLEADN